MASTQSLLDHRSLQLWSVPGTAVDLAPFFPTPPRQLRRLDAEFGVGDDGKGSGEPKSPP